MNETEIQAILKRYRQGLCTDVERKAIEAWIAEELQKGDWSASSDRKHQLKITLKQQIDAEIQAHVSMPHSARRLPSSFRFRIVRWSAAALIFMVLSFALYWFINSKTTSTEAVLTTDNRYDVAPGGNRAILLLDDGRKIDLADTASVALANTAGVRLSNANGQLLYTVSERNTGNGPAKFHTIRTPYAGQYQVLLADGTQVWLNAASSLQYFASSHPEKERRVVLKGEAYFEVAKNKNLPFIVETEEQEIRVWGTHFNVNAYRDEPTTKTTLLEGSVSIQVKGKASPVYLKPNQQAQVLHGDIRVSPTRSEGAIAWKNGYFRFDDESIESIMRKISRWYNVEVVSKNINKQQVFTGTVSRFEQVSKVLEKLELTGGVHFQIETGAGSQKERRIIVMP